MKLNKHQLILRDIAAVHLDDFRGREQELLLNWDYYNVERIVERTMAHLGGYEFVDAHGYDNTDYSETKTGTIRRHDSMATITNITTVHKDTPKVGDIRAVFYNEFTGQLDYYFLPKAGWEAIREYGASNKNILRARYNHILDVIPKWKAWRVPDFESLALTPATISSPYEYAPLDCPRNSLFDWAA
jgi:hypothetical protein